MTANPGILWTALFFFLAIGPLIFLHELGHYLVGRWCGVKADVFSIGFGKEIVGWTDKRGTRWKLSGIPLGGYCKFAGDMNAASQPSADWKSLPQAERDVTFQSKPVWKRALIVFAGPFTNFLIAFVILGGFAIAFGDPQTRPVAAMVQPNSAAEKAGIRVGDRISAIGGTKIDRFEDIAPIVQDHPGERLMVVIERSGQYVALDIVPSEIKERDRFGNIYRYGRIGIGNSDRVWVPVSLLEAPKIAVSRTISILDRMITGLGRIISGRVPITEIGGPLKIAQISGQIATLGWMDFVSLMAMLSINLGFMNLLPVPVLDGGHLAMYAFEAIRRKPLSERAQGLAFGAGMFTMMALMLFVTFNDLRSFGVWEKLAGLIG